MWVSGPGTIADMLAEADAADYPATERLIRDWTHHAQLDCPRRRPAGRGHGSEPALHPAAQPNLFVTLLSKGAGISIASLARIPIDIWTYWATGTCPCT